MVREIKDAISAIIRGTTGLHELALGVHSKENEYIASFETEFSLPTDQLYPAIYMEDNNVIPGGRTEYNGYISNMVIICVDKEPPREIMPFTENSATFEMLNEYLRIIRERQSILNDYVKQIIDVLTGKYNHTLPWVPDVATSYTWLGHQNMDIDRYTGNISTLYPIGYFLSYRNHLIGSGYSVSLGSSEIYCSPKCPLPMDFEKIANNMVAAFADSPETLMQMQLPSNLTQPLTGFAGQTTILRSNFPNIGKELFRNILTILEEWQVAAPQDKPLKEEEIKTLLGIANPENYLITIDSKGYFTLQDKNC